MPSNAEPSLFSREGARRLSHAAQYGVLVFVAWAIGLLGVDRASAVMGALWRALAPFNSRHARADRHLAAAFPDWTAERRRRVLGDMWENLGRTAAETVLLPDLLAEADARITWDGLPADVLEPAKTGAIFVSLHTGNWEVVSRPMVAAGLPLYAFYKPLRNRTVDAWLADRRRALYGDGLMAFDKAMTFRMKSLARHGGVLAVLGDLNDPNGFVLDFFGRKASATTFPALLARRLRLPLFVGRSIRTDGAHFRLDGRWLEVPATDDAQADAEQLTRDIHAVFEEWIRQYPGQWMWAHRKWL